MTALRIRPHLRAHVLSTTEVALLGESGRFALHGEIYAALVPLIDGTRDADAIVAALAHSFPRERLHFALMQLNSRRYVEQIDAPPRDLAAEAWRIAGEPAIGEGGAPPRRAVHLIDAGAYPPAFRILHQALECVAGFSSSFRSDGLVLIATGDYLDPQFAAAVESARSCHRWVLPVRLAGATLWLGPLIDGNGGDRFGRLLTRLADNRPADMAALRHGASFPLLPPMGVPETFQLAAAWIASAVAAINDGTLPPGLTEGVLTLDPRALEVHRHFIAYEQPDRNPGATASTIGRLGRIELASSPKRFTADGGHRTCPPHETLARLGHFVSPITGVVPGIERLPSPEAIYVYAATQISVGKRVGYQSNRLLGAADLACGKGASDEQARASCLAEAIERYSCGYFGDEELRLDRVDQLGETAIHPERLQHFSDAQFSHREERNAVRGRGYNWIPMRFDPTRAIEWVPAWSLTFQRVAWLPAAFCYYDYPIPVDHQFCYANSNGCAAGNTREEAIVQGFLELVERDACALWWYNRSRRPGINLASFADPYFDAMVAEFDRHGRSLEVLDVTTDLGIPTVMAISWWHDDGGRIHLGLGSHMEPRLAISRAISELNQGAVYDLMNWTNAEPRDSAHARWLREERISAHPYLRPAAGPSLHMNQLEDHSTLDLRDDVLWCVEQLRAHGLEMIVLDQTRADIGFPVVRVVVPALRHFWERLGPGRLYDVPVALGWLDRPTSESEVNPIPFFI